MSVIWSFLPSEQFVAAEAAANAARHDEKWLANRVGHQAIAFLPALVASFSAFLETRWGNFTSLPSIRTPLWKRVNVTLKECMGSDALDS